jgi:hypothetical protein
MPLPYDTGVREAVRADRLETFRGLAEHWSAKGHLVLKAADFTGRFARLFADFDGSKKLRKTDMDRALEIVKVLCTARREGTDLVFLDWCS